LFDYIVAKGRLSHEESAKFLRQILSALEYCHETSVIHRDLKPENLLLDNHKNIKINDFGLSNVMTHGQFLQSSCGSPHYSSPEILQRTKYIGPEVDIWSVGVILYAMVTGTLPWPGEQLQEQLQHAVAGKFSLPHHVSTDCADLIRRMLVTDSSKRATMDEIRNHPFIVKHGGVLPSCVSAPIIFTELDSELVENLKALSFERDAIEDAVLQNKKTSQIYQLYSLMYRQKNENFCRSCNERESIGHPLEGQFFVNNFLWRFI